MTHVYERYVMPHKLDVRCPDCAALASFEFPTVVDAQRKHYDFFRKSKKFELWRFKDGSGVFSFGAVYHPGLHGTHIAPTDIPEGFSPSQWEQSRYLRPRSSGEEGTLVCPTCFLRRKAALSWPEMAFFQIDVRGHTLWAFHRESALDLYHFVASKERQHAAFRWGYFLRHVPGRFLDAKLRDEICKKLLKLLAPLNGSL